jgi:virginiamycin B lyase
MPSLTKRKLALILALGLSCAAIGLAQNPPSYTEFAIPTATSGPVAVASGPDGALWFTEFFANKIGRLTTAGAFTEYPITTANSGPTAITRGSDGALWFIEYSANQIGRISTSGAVTEYALPTPQSGLDAITTGQDGAVWFTENLANKIGRISPSGLLNEYSLPTAQSAPYGITGGPDGAVWFTETGTNKIGRITNGGVFAEFSVPTILTGLTDITTGPDGSLWFIALSTFRIGSMTTSGAFSYYAIPGVNGNPSGIMAGSDGAIWFLQLRGLLMRITTAGVFSTYTAPTSDVRSPISGPDGAIWFTEYLSGKIARAAITISAATPIISGAALPAGTTGSPYSTQLTASGGTPPYSSWTVTTGALPAGLALNSATGAISGTPLAAGTSTVSVTVRDSLGAISPPQVLSIAVAAQACTYSLSAGSAAFPSAGGFGSVNVTAPAGCSWLVTSIPSWVTITAGSAGTGSASVNFTVAANGTNSPVNATMTIAGIPFTIQVGASIIPNFIGSMPHVVSDGGWSTTFTFVNKGPSAAQARLNLYDSNGTPLSLALTLPQQSATPSNSNAASSTLAADASWIVQASGSGPQYSEGSAQLSATGAVDGFAIFRFNPSQQEAVVPMETRSASSYILAFDNTNNVLTGVAIENISPGSSGIPVNIRNDAGTLLSTTILTVPSNGHKSFVLSTQYPITANIRGTIEFVTTPLAQISVLGIRYTPPGTLTTIPAFANVAGGLGLFPHLAAGGGWQSTFVLVNTGTSTAQTQLSFFDNNGNPLPLPLTILQTGSSSTAASVTQNIPAFSSVWIQGGPAGSALQTGSAQLNTAGNVAAYAIYRYVPNGQEAASPLETRSASAYVIPFDNTNGTATGIALSSAASQSVVVPVVIRDDAGNQIGTSTMLLNGNGHASFTLASQTQGFPVTANIRGTVEFDTPAGAKLSVLGIRTPPSLTFTTLPALAK